MKQKSIQHKIRRKKHYDNKLSINLMVDNRSNSENITKADVEQDYILPMSYHQGFALDEDFSFEEPFNQTLVMAKAYDDTFHEINHSISTAKAYSDELIPEDTTNEYSDVFKMDDDSLFDDVDLIPSENQKQVESMANQVEDDDAFARDLQAVLSGKKSLANLAHHTENKSPTPENTTKKEVDPVKQMEEKMAKDEAIFDQIAADRNRVTTYQLGDIELTSIFDEADINLENNRVATAKNRIENIIDEQSMAMSGMEYAEDFEVIDSIADSENSKKQNERSTEYNELKEEVIEISSDDHE